MITIKSDACNTRESVEFYKRYMDMFGEITEAEMIKEDCYILKLTNNNREEFIFEYGLTAGCNCEGAQGTLEVLRLAGFAPPDDIVFLNETFKLKK
jgi:hypothetical protein